MKKHRTAVVAGVAAAVALAGAAALPAQAAKPQPISQATYSALGDSFASGFGAGLYNELGQSAQAYPVVLAGDVNKVNLRAVGFGGTTGTVADYQIPFIPGTTQQVTLTVGGNDLGFVDKATACLADPGACVLTDADQAKLAGLPAAVAANIAAIHAKAPAATIYVTGYPLLFQAAQTPDNTGWCVIGQAKTTVPAGSSPLIASEAQADALDAAAVALNAAIESAIAGPTNRYAKFVDVTGAFTGHGLCGTPSYTSQVPNPDSYINPVNMVDGAVVVAMGPLHPNADGQTAYAASVRAKGFKNIKG